MKSNWKKLLSLALVLALMLGFAPGIGTTARAESALPANGSDAGDGLKYFVGFTNVTGSGAVETFNINANSLVDGYGDAKHKFCWRFDTNTVGVTFESSAPFVPQKYYLRTADGAAGGYPDRNPKDWKIYGKLTATDGWTMIAEVANDNTMESVNYQAYEFRFNNPDNKAFQCFKFEVTDVRGTDPRNGRKGQKLLELSELYMSGTPAAGGTATEYAALVNTTTTVRFNNMDWYIIADDSTAVDAGTVTLLAKDPIGALRFNDRSSSSASVYAESEVKEYLDGFATGTGSFAGVADAIAATDLTDVSVTGAKLYLLNREEANALPMAIRKCAKAASAEYNQWWLRTPSSVIGSEGCKGAYIVDGAQGYLQEDTGVQYVMGVRPALRLDLSKVTFSNNTFALPVPPVASVTTSGGTTTEYTTFAAALNAWTNNSTLTLLSDVTTSSTISVSGTKTLDLNGYGVLMKGNDRVISVQGNASLTLNDSNPGKSHYITLNDYRGTSVANSGVESFSNGNGVVKVDGGYLTGGIRSSGEDGPTAGAGVLINQGGTFVLNGGTIVGNTITNNNSGSGVRNDNGIFTMNGGKITYNKAGRHGGGLTTTGSENCTVHGGEISNNYAVSSAGGVQAAGSFALTGGSIVNNASGNPGGGVYAGGGLTISGNVKITGNTASGKADNLYLASNNLTVSGNLADGAQVGVNMQTPGVFTNSTDTAFNDASKFISDNAGYAVGKNSSGQLELRVPPAASVTSGGTTTEYTTFSAALNAWTNNSTLTLLSDVTTDSTISVSGTKTLDLNGHGIRMTGSGSVINVGGASLTLNDSAPNALHKYTIQNPKSNGAGLAVVDDANGTQTFTGGYITGGNTADRGGGVVVNGGSLTMNGGTVIGNNAALHGGGVALKELGGTFIMNGGALIGNTGKYGGGLSMINGSRGTVNGGKIQYNCTSKNGGGIHTDGAGYRASLTVTGGTITNNYCDGDTVSGGGVLVSGMTFNLSGSVEIKDNLRKSGADNLCLIAGKTVIVADTLSNSTPIGVTMKTPSVFTNTASDKVSYNDAAKFVSDDAGYAVFQNSSGQLELRVPPAASVTSGGTTTEYMAFSDALGAWADGSTLTLLSDVEASSTISVTGTKTLDLNGHGIRMTGSGSVIHVGSGASLTLNDSDPNGAHNTQTFTGGYITGGNTANNGGGVLINGGSLTMNGGTIKDNNANTGGGVYVVSGATLHMTGGAIEGNRATHNGAGVAVEGGATFQMSGGAIRYNVCNGDTGGVLLRAASANFTMSGGSIQYNTGGAIGGIGSFKAQPKFSGAPVVKDNVKGGTVSNTGTGYILEGGTPCNVYNIDSVIAIVGALQDGAEIGMTIPNVGVGVFTGSTDTSFNDATKFVSDNSSYAVGKNSSGQLFLAAPVTVTFDTKGGSAVDAQTVASGSLVTEPAAPTKTNDTFAGWYTDETYTTAFDFGTMIIDTDTTLCAQWASKPVHTVSGTVKQGGAAVSGVDVRLVQGERVIAVTATNTAGEFSVSASDGIYNIIAATAGKTKTELVTLNANQQVDITMPAENVNSTLTVTGSEIKNVMVGGLDELAMTDSEPGKTVTVTMTVEEKEDAANKSDIQEIAAANQSLDCLEIKIEKTVDSGAAEDVTDTGSKVLEIVVPYRFTGKKDVEVYRYHGSVEKLKKEDSKADGTYQTDENNGLIYIYASKFSTYAIGYTQLYTVACPINYGSYTGTVTVSLLDASDNVVASHAIDVNNGSGTYSFAGVPEGEYKLRAVWTEGEKETTLNGSLNVQ